MIFAGQTLKRPDRKMEEHLGDRPSSNEETIDLAQQGTFPMSNMVPTSASKKEAEEKRK